VHAYLAQLEHMDQIVEQIMLISVYLAQQVSLDLQLNYQLLLALVNATKASTVLLVPLELLRINAAGFNSFAHQEQERPLRFQMASTRVR